MKSKQDNSFKNHEASAVLGVRNFHKKAGRHEQIRQREIEEAKYSDPQTGELKKDLIEYRICPTCQDDNYEVSFLKQGFSYCRCLSCSMIYVNPILNEKANDSGYADDKFGDLSLKVYLDPINRQFDEPKFIRALELIEGVLNSSTRESLDIGCCAGHFLQVAKERGWNPTGIELGKAAADYTTKLGFSVYDKPLSYNQFPDNSFDLVTMWDVFEHLQNPGEILSIIHKILKPNGIIGMIIPNVDSLAARIMRQHCNMFIGSKHLNMFNRDTLNKILSRNEFKILHTESLIGEINAINNYLNYQHPYMGDSKTTGSVLGLISEDDIHKNYLGYKIFCLAMKK